MLCSLFSISCSKNFDGLINCVSCCSYSIFYFLIHLLLCSSSFLFLSFNALIILDSPPLSTLLGLERTEDHSSKQTMEGETSVVVSN